MNTATCNALLICTGFDSRDGYRDNPLAWARVKIQTSETSAEPVHSALYALRQLIDTDRKAEEFFYAAPGSTGHAGIMSAQQLTTMKIVDAAIDDCGWMALPRVITAAARRGLMPHAIFEWHRPPTGMWKMLHDYNPHPFPYLHDFTPRFDARHDNL